MRDTGVAQSDPELHALVAAMLTEYDRQTRVSCPCRVELQAFSSVRECMQRFGTAADYIDCATRAFKPADGPELRAAIRCQVEESQQRVDCLESHGCAREDIAMCYAMVKDCPQIDGEDLTVVVYSCVGVFGISP